MKETLPSERLRTAVRACVEVVAAKPRRELIGKLWRKARRTFAQSWRHSVSLRRDSRHPTYIPTSLLCAEVGRRLKPLPVEDLGRHAKVVRVLTGRYLEHRFDLLGSGWTKVEYGTSCRGFEGHRYDPGAALETDPDGIWIRNRVNPSNAEEAGRIWALVDSGYVPIDWQLDFKSGFRWSECTWFRQVPIGHLPGVDIKVPWELARMQHFAQFSLAYALARNGAQEFRAPEVYAGEFRNQVLDFMANNPPRFGVNWTSTMEVAIRVSNWLLAYDLFRAHGHEFDLEFAAIFTRTVWEHGLHIATNLEWNPVSPETRGNHYLANIVGLLFVAAYLPRTPITDAWLAFSIQELVTEVGFQFHADGSNFEGSTSYHRLSAEMVLFATALVLGLDEDEIEALDTYATNIRPALPRLKDPPIPRYETDGLSRPTPFPDGYAQRLERMVRFTVHVTKPGGHIHQVGDNDSGRFLKLQPKLEKLTVADARERYENLVNYEDLPDEATYWDENVLDHGHLLSAAKGLGLGRGLSAEPAEHLDGLLTLALARGEGFHTAEGSTSHQGSIPVGVGTESEWVRGKKVVDRLPENQKILRNFGLPPGALDGLQQFAYPDFGLFIYRSPRLYLGIRSKAEGKNHAHNDLLSIELNIDGRDIVADPGTYVYTPLPAQRNVYRSIHAHYAPFWAAEEPARLDRGLFHLRPNASAVCLYFGPRELVGRLDMGARRILRLISLNDKDISIVDGFLGSSTPASSQGPRPAHAISLSNGYGKIRRDVSTPCWPH